MQGSAACASAFKQRSETLGAPTAVVWAHPCYHRCLQALRLDDAWRPLAATIADYEARVQQLLSLLHASSGPSGLAELALQLDFNNFYSRLQAEADERRQREQWRHVAAAGKEAAVHAR